MGSRAVVGEQPLDGLGCVEAVVDVEQVDLVGGGQELQVVGLRLEGRGKHVSSVPKGFRLVEDRDSEHRIARCHASLSICCPSNEQGRLGIVDGG